MARELPSSFLLTFVFLSLIVCLLGLQVSALNGAAEHRNGVRFPGEPVAVMAECFFMREKGNQEQLSPVTHWRFSAGKGKRHGRFYDLPRLSRKTCLEGRMKSHGFLAFYAGV